MFRDWKEIYLTSVIPVLCYSTLFLASSKTILEESFSLKT